MIPMYDQIMVMGMLDILSFNGYEVIRVPGGWMFTLVTTVQGKAEAASSCFVPDPPPKEELNFPKTQQALAGFPKTSHGCEHEWATVTHEYIANAEECLICHTVRARSYDQDA